MQQLDIFGVRLLASQTGLACWVTNKTACSSTVTLAKLWPGVKRRARFGLHRPDEVMASTNEELNSILFDAAASKGLLKFIQRYKRR